MRDDGILCQWVNHTWHTEMFYLAEQKWCVECRAFTSPKRNKAFQDDHAVTVQPCPKRQTAGLDASACALLSVCKSVHGRISTRSDCVTLIKSVANPWWLSLQSGLQTAGIKITGSAFCECIRVHGAMDVQREEQNVCMKRTRERSMGGRWKCEKWWREWDSVHAMDVERKRWTGECKQRKVTSDLLRGKNGRKKAVINAQKDEDQTLHKWPVLLMAVITKERRGTERAEDWLFLFCLSLFSAGSQQDWV